MRRLARGFCPTPGQLTLPSPHANCLSRLEKFSLPSRYSTNIERLRVGPGGGCALIQAAAIPLSRALNFGGTLSEKRQEECPGYRPSAQRGALAEWLRHDAKGYKVISVPKSAVPPPLLKGS